MLLDFTLSSATVQMGNLGSGELLKSPSVIHLLLPNKESHHTFQQTQQANKGKGYWCFTFSGTTQKDTVCLSTLQTDLTYLWGTWFQGLAIKRTEALTLRVSRNSALFSVYIDLSSFSLLDYFGKFHSVHIYFFLWEKGWRKRKLVIFVINYM